MSSNYEHPPVPEYQSAYQQPVGPYPPQNGYAKQAAGAKHAQNSLLFGILAFVVVGLVFGPLAIIEAKKAEELGVDANVGKILGWVGTCISGGSLIIFGAFFLLAIVSGGSGY